VLDEPVDPKHVRTVTRRLGEACGELRRSRFLASFTGVLGSAEVRPEVSVVEEVVVYGLGSPVDGPPQVKYQFALAVLLSEELKRAKHGGNGGAAIPVLFFDPVFTAIDREVIESYEGFSVLRDNENCRRAVGSKRTLFFMPHCHPDLYDHLLGANWSPGQLANLLILGNSFQGYKQKWGNVSPSAAAAKPKPNKMMTTTTTTSMEEEEEDSQEFPKLVWAAEHAREVPIPQCNFVEAGAFNDMSIHYFPGEDICIPTM